MMYMIDMMFIFNLQGVFGGGSNLEDGQLSDDAIWQDREIRYVDTCYAFVLYIYRNVVHGEFTGVVYFCMLLFRFIIPIA